MADIDQAQLEARLRELGLIPAGYSGPVEVTATTATGKESVKIIV